MNRLLTGFLCSLLVVTAAVSAHAATLRTLVVSTDGDDAADGVTNPWRTL